MNKIDYEKLHAEIALKYKTLPRCIKSIRVLHTYGYSLQKMIARSLRKKRNSLKYKDYYAELMRFLLSLDEVEIEKICL